ncbi:hypothetical protein C0Q88_11925 [Ralstonia pickettii]|uniref:Methyl-accepting chemotaxis sensory transducer n=1 Tax=Ralstonia pickettii TaxID=329 RepID=A0A2N4TSG1_RALPI|nr:hypothetical protein C0Q88_11925 [Ralstonia pickettii]
MQQMHEVTQQNAALVEEAAQPLEDRAAQLKGAVSVFRLARHWSSLGWQPQHHARTRHGDWPLKGQSSDRRTRSDL